MSRHALYRYYDARGVLLYIGVTWHPKSRHKQHCRNSPWIIQAVRFSVMWFRSKVERPRAEHFARSAERQAIQQERPLYNLRGIVKRRNGVHNRQTGLVAA